MSTSPPTPLLSSNARIPIYVNSADKDEPSNTADYVCPTCEISSKDQPIHCISHSSHASPAPPSYRSIVTQAPATGRLAVPELNVVTSNHSPRPQAPLPALQFDPEGRPNLRFRRNAFSPLSPTPSKRDGIDWSRKSHIGLGIPEIQFGSDTTPITPGTVERTGGEQAEHTQDASNFAQRIEQKLWKYSASGNVVKRWLIEIISWTLSAVCMAGIVGMLFFYKDKRIPKWPLGLTLNAYISVLSKVASAALLLPVSEALGQLKWSWFQGDNSKKMWDFEIFDNASRGPWGSLLLLVRTKGRSLAALGAAVTIFALALDPFFQQVVEYPERWRLQSGTGSVPRAVSYEPYLSGTEYRHGTENLEYDQKMLGVTYSYFYDRGAEPITFGKGIRAEVPLACPSSNCTWPEYETLGIHSECVEAPESIDFKCLTAPLDWVQEPITNDSGVFYPEGSSCGWWLKADDPILMSGYSLPSDETHPDETLIMRAQPIYDVMSREPIPGYQAKLNNSRNPLAHVVLVSGETVANVKRNATPSVQECILSWSVKTMSSTYSEGGYHEELTNEIVNGNVNSSLWFTRTLYDENVTFLGQEYIYLENVTIQGNSGQEYMVDNRTHVMTLSLFDDIFPSAYSVVNSTDDADAMLRYKQYITIMPYTRNMTYNPYIYKNVSMHLDQLATAMTNLMRSAVTHTEQLSGPAYEQESFVDVRWPWLALPLTLLTLTFLFLVATVTRSSIEQEHVGVWKTSAIATLLYGLPDEMQKKITSSKQTGTPRAKAKEIKLKWLPKSGWRFSGNGGLSPSTIKARQTMSSTASSNPHHSLNSPRLSDSTLIATPSVKSPLSTPSFGTLSRAPSVKSFSSSPTLECPSGASSLKSPPSPPLKETTISPPVSPFEPSFPTPPLESCTPSPPFAFQNHPSPLASNPSLPLESPRNTQTYYEANPHAYYRTHPPAQPQVSSETNSQRSQQTSHPPTNLQRNHLASPSPPNIARNHQATPPSANLARNYQASPPLANPQMSHETIPQRNYQMSPPPANSQVDSGASPPAGPSPSVIPFVRSHARRPSKPRYPTPPQGWI